MYFSKVSCRSFCDGFLTFFAINVIRTVRTSRYRSKIQVLISLVGFLSAQSDHVTTNQRFATEYCEVYGCNPLKAVTAVRYCRICIRGHDHRGKQCATYGLFNFSIFSGWGRPQNNEPMQRVYESNENSNEFQLKRFKIKKYLRMSFISNNSLIMNHNKLFK